MHELERVLFVAWENPTSRRFYPVARLTRTQDERGDLLYEFVYIKGVREAESSGFRPFLNFPDLNQRYLGRRLFPMFSNRLMSSKRADYPLYLTRLGLDVESSTDFEVLGRSGGRRTTDAIEVFSLPTLDEATGTQRMYFFAHALRYLAPSSWERMGQLVAGERLNLMADLQNPVDPSAIALRTRDFVIVGFVPAYLTGLFASQLQQDDRTSLVVERINADPAPLQQRLLCFLKTPMVPSDEPAKMDHFLPLGDGLTGSPLVGSTLGGRAGGR